MYRKLLTYIMIIFPNPLHNLVFTYVTYPLPKSINIPFLQTHKPEIHQIYSVVLKNRCIKYCARQTGILNESEKLRLFFKHNLVFKKKCILHYDIQYCIIHTSQSFLVSFFLKSIETHLQTGSLFSSGACLQQKCYRK